MSTALAVIGVLGSLAALLFIRFYLRNAVDSYAEDASREFAIYKRQIELAGEVKVLEGLPHPEIDPDQFLVESLRPDTTKIRGNNPSDSLDIYNQPVPINPLEALQLTNIVTDRNSVSKKSNSAARNPFHADYALSFDRGEANPIRVFICFDCQQLLFTGEHKSLRYSLTDDGEEQLKNILAGKSQNRPPAAHRSFFEQAIELNEQVPSP